MPTRMTHPGALIPDAMQALQSLERAIHRGAVPTPTLRLVQLRASQINGCSFCIELHARDMKKAGETDERVSAVVAWRGSSRFTDAERAALELTEAVTRLSDRTDPVPDSVWETSKLHYDDAGLATLLLAISAINVWNRLSVATKQTPMSH